MFTPSTNWRMDSPAVPLLSENEHEVSSLIARKPRSAFFSTWSCNHLSIKSSLCVAREFVQGCGRHVFSRSCLVTTLPMYLQPGGLQGFNKSPSQTTYLDAVRGLAAIIVVNHHYQFDAQSPIIGAPFVNFLQQGQVMVDTFFIISGLVLTRSTLGLIRQERPSGDILNSLASSIFRRHMRLFLPCGLGTFIAMVLVYAGLSAPLYDAKRLDNFPAQVLDWAKDFLFMMNPFNSVTGYLGDSRRSHYLEPIWTIPVEFRGSLVVFMFCLTCCRMRPTQRQLLCWALILLGYIWCAVYVSLFMFGVFLAEQSLRRGESRGQLLPSKSKPETAKQASFTVAVVNPFISAAILLVAVVICSGQRWNYGAFRAPPTPAGLIQLIPPWWPVQHESGQHLWTSISAALILLGLETCPLYQRPFDWHFSQYIGHLSFGIYIIHQPLLRLEPRRALMHFLTERFGPSALLWIGDYTIFMFVTVWAADYFIRADRYIVAWGRQLERYLFKQPRA